MANQKNIVNFNRCDWSGKSGQFETLGGGYFIIKDIDTTYAKWQFIELEHEGGIEISMVNQVTGREIKGDVFFGNPPLPNPIYIFTEMGLSREDENPMVAFAQLVFNLV